MAHAKPVVPAAKKARAKAYPCAVCASRNAVVIQQRNVANVIFRMRRCCDCGHHYGTVSSRRRPTREKPYQGVPPIRHRGVLWQAAAA